MLRKIYLAIALIAFTYSVKAEGYAVNAQGAKQIGMGHVGVALNWDASSMQFNPGALATLDAKYSLAMGGSLIWSKTEFTSPDYKNNATDNPINTPFYLYGSAKLNDKLAVGLAVYTPFGSSNIWGDNWDGKYLIQEISMKSIYIQPTVSYKVNDWMSVGAGLNIVYGQFELSKALPTGANDKANLSGNTIKYGYNIGIFLQPTEKLNIGISYRSQVDIELDNSEGEAEFNVALPLTDLSGNPSFANTSFTATLPLPASLNVGFAYQIDEKWLVSADVNFVKWDVYKTLSFDFKDETKMAYPNPDPATNTSVPFIEIPAISDTESIRDWDNAMSYRIGAQYSYNEKLDLRAGFYYDETPVQENYYAPETPGANKIGITAGASYKLNNKFSLDAAILYGFGEKTEGYDTNPKSQGFGGEYKNTAIFPTIGITYNL
ncbi:OmpP1/FadL family transporter [Ancylomarina sp. YFZ004]